MPAGLVSSEVSLLSLQMATLWLSLHMVFSMYTCTPAVSLCVQISSSKDTSQIGFRPILMAHFSLITS